MWVFILYLKFRMSYKLNYISLVYLLTLAPFGLENQYQCFESVRSQTTGSGSVLPDYRKKEFVPG